jgi:uncharacterized membrane protein
MKKFNDLTKNFSDLMRTENNSNRLFGLDFARLIAMLMMVQGHTLFALLDINIINSGKWYWDFWTFVRGLTAPVFLMVSGAVHIFANKRDENGIFPNKIAKKRIKICLMLLIVGYLLQFPVNNIYDLVFLDTNNLYNFFKVNVLQMFSATLLFLTLLFKITKNNKQLGIFAFIFGNLILLASHFVLQINWFDFFPAAIASYFSMSYGSIFPLFPFSGYLLIGTFVGYLLQKQAAENRNFYLIKTLFLLGIPYLIIGYFVDNWYVNQGFRIIGAAKIGLGVTIIRVGLTMWVIALASLFSVFLQKFQKSVSMLSKRAIFIYVIHLLIIYGSPITPGLRHLFFNIDIFTAFYCAFFVIFFSVLLVYLYDLTNKSEKIKQFYKFFIVALLIYLLLI